MPLVHQEKESQHTEEMNEIITAPPSWLLRWGITLFFGVLLVIFGMSALIRYPDIVKTSLKINSTNSPKPVVAKSSGRITRLLTQENEIVSAGQAIAFLETTANHADVLNILEKTKRLQLSLVVGEITGLEFLENPTNLQLGETQAFYQEFYQSFVLLKSSLEGGFYLKKKAFLLKELESIKKQKIQLAAQQQIQQEDYSLAEQEYNVYEKLTRQKVMARMELKTQESKLLSKKYPLHQTEAAFISNASQAYAKEKEIMEQDNQIGEERARFTQALNSFISNLELWKSKYVLSASQSGKITYARIIEENQVVNAGDEIFYINAGNTNFFGEMTIPQYNMGKVKRGQEVLIKLKSFPYEEYGMLRGKISYMADIPYNDSVFISKVDLNKNAFSSLKLPLNLKNGMTADAEIITEDATLLSRLLRSFNSIVRQ